MEISGTIKKINDELDYGFIKVPKMEDVFFSKDSCSANLPFSSLKIDQVVYFSIQETKRGLFASNIQLSKPKSEPVKRQPESTL